MSETGDTNIEYNIGTSNVNLPVRYNDTKIRNYIDKEIFKLERVCSFTRVSKYNKKFITK